MNDDMLMHAWSHNYFEDKRPLFFRGLIIAFAFEGSVLGLVTLAIHLLR